MKNYEFSSTKPYLSLHTKSNGLAILSLLEGEFPKQVKHFPLQRNFIKGFGSMQCFIQKFPCRLVHGLEERQ